MPLFFAWEKRDVPFNPNRHARQDLAILTLSIHHKENHHAKAYLCHPSAPLPGNNLWAFISYRKNSEEAICLFKGRLEKSPQKLSPLEYTLVLTAKPQDDAAQLKKILEEHKKSPLFDPLFFKDTELPEAILTRTQPVAIYRDPVTHKGPVANCLSVFLNIFAKL